MKKTIFIISLSFLFFWGCFDYSEIIFFNKDFSGSIHINYTLPVNEKQVSRISFLPVQKDKIKKYYSSLVEDKKIRLSPIEVKKVKDKPKYMKVSYKIFFTNPRILEKNLFRNVKVFKERTRLQIQRTFSLLQEANMANALFLERTLSYLLEKLKKHSLTYQIYFPKEWKINTNRGKLIKEGHLFYKHPLELSLKNTESMSWFLTLRKGE